MFSILRVLRCASLLEVIVIVSICLGTRISDGLLCLLVVSLQRHSSSWVALSDKRKCVVSASSSSSFLDFIADRMLVDPHLHHNWHTAATNSCCRMYSILYFRCHLSPT